jgi:hypothetical protein
MSDILVDNKDVYNFELNFLYYFNMITKLTIILFIIGFFQSEPIIMIEFTFIIKIILALFLIYRFNNYRQKHIRFTELDRKVCYSSGIYIIIISFIEFINNYTEYIRKKYILPYTKPIIHSILSYTKINKPSLI